MTGPTIDGRDDSKKERKDTMLKSMSQDLGYHISASVADSFMIPSWQDMPHFQGLSMGDRSLS